MKFAMVLIVLIAAIGCSNIDRSLIFFTNTTTGLEVSASGTTADPVRIILGYKRQEGVINPVYDAAGIETVSYDVNGYPQHQTDKYRDEAYSVIAKYQGGSTGSAGDVSAAATNAQWFATGEAAVILAGQPGIAGAVTGSSDVAKAAAEQAKALAVSGDLKKVYFAALSGMLDALDSLAEGRDAEAALQRARLNELDVPSNWIHGYDTMYTWRPKAGELDHAATQAGPPSGDFANLLAHWQEATDTLDALTSASVAAAKNTPAEVKANDLANGSSAQLTLAAITTRRDDLAKSVQEFEDRLGKEPKLVDAIRYYVNKLLGN